MKKARLIVTMNCIRKCSYCCNKYEGILTKATTLSSLFPLKHYEEILITGGEPLDDPKRTLKIIEVLKALNPAVRLYLYTARYTVEMIHIMDKVDGIQFTLHEGASIADVIGFNKFQAIAGMYPDKSFRLYMHPKVKHRIPVKPSMWSRVESKPWLTERECTLPEGEELFILKLAAE